MSSTIIVYNGLPINRYCPGTNTILKSANTRHAFFWPRYSGFRIGVDMDLGADVVSIKQ